MVNILTYKPLSLSRSTVEFMLAPKENLTTRTYNVHAMSFTPEEIFAEVMSDKEYDTDCDISGEEVGARADYRIPT